MRIKANDNRTYRNKRIKMIIKNNGACMYCIRKWSGTIKRYRTNC